MGIGFRWKGGKRGGGERKGKKGYWERKGRMALKVKDRGKS